jgi:hypothetical protein
MFSLLLYRFQQHPVLKEVDVPDAAGHGLRLFEEGGQPHTVLGYLQPDHLPRDLLVS